MSTNQIEKKTLLKASRSRVWRALSDSKEFGSWFGMKFDGPFVTGKKITGKLSPTTVDPEVAKLQEPYAGMAFEFLVDRIEPERLFSIQWHPYATDPEMDYSQEPMTLITFTLEEKEDGVLLTLVESGFDEIPLTRRAKALAANDGGWTHQMALIAKYLALHAK